jgi:hypothetical protein
MTPAEPKIPLTVYIPPALRQQIEHEAKEDRRTLSVCVELALTEHFRDKKIHGLSMDAKAAALKPFETLSEAGQ